MLKSSSRNNSKGLDGTHTSLTTANCVNRDNEIIIYTYNILLYHIPKFLSENSVKRIKKNYVFQLKVSHMSLHWRYSHNMIDVCLEDSQGMLSITYVR